MSLSWARGCGTTGTIDVSWVLTGSSLQAAIKTLASGILVVKIAGVDAPNNSLVLSEKWSLTCKVNYTVNSSIWRFPKLVGTPKSSIYRWIFQEHVYKPSSELGDPPWLWKPMNQWIWWCRGLYLLRGGVLLVILTAFRGHIRSRLLVAGILTCIIIGYTCLLDNKLRYLGTCLELAKHFIN